MSALANGNPVASHRIVLNGQIISTIPLNYFSLTIKVINFLTRLAPAGVRLVS